MIALSVAIARVIQHQNAEVASRNAYLFIVPMRTSLEVLERVAYNLLVQLQPNNQF